MSKEKKKKEEKTESVSIDELIIKEFGDIITNAEYIKELRSQIIPITPRFDIALSGGIPFGTFMTIGGKSGQGKSSLSLHIAAQAQQVPCNKAEREVYYFDIEGRLKYKDLIGNKRLNINPDKFKLIQSKSGNILSGEQFIDIGEKLINTKYGSIFIFDSFSSICTKSRMEGNIGDRFRDDTVLLLASFCRRISQVVAINQSLIIGINHMISSQGGMGHAQYIESGGNKIKYQSDVKIVGTYFQPWTDTDGTVLGQSTNWKIEKSALGPPFGEVKSYIRYGYGFDEIFETIEIAVDVGIVAKAGAGWFTYGDLKLQGIEKLRNTLFEDKNLFEKLKKEVDNIYKI